MQRIWRYFERYAYLNAAEKMRRMGHTDIAEKLVYEAENLK